MSEKANQTLRPPAGGMLSFNVAEEAARLKNKQEWSSGDRVAVSLVKDAPLNILLMVLKKGARLSEHRTKGPIAVHVISGCVDFRAGTEQVQLSPGGIAALAPDVAHELAAVEESVVLLTTAVG